MPVFGDRRHRFLHGGRGILVDPAAGFADQEGDDLVRAMAVQAGDIGILRREPVDEALLDQEIERPVDRDRREAAPAGRRDAVGEIIGPDRAVVGMERLQRLPPDRGQAQAPLATDAFGPGEGLRGVAAMVLGMAARPSAWACDAWS